MENEQDFIQSQEDTEETVNQDEADVDTEDTTEEPTEDEKDKVIKTLEAQKEHWRKKAQEAQKPEGKTQSVQSSNDLTQKDLFAMVKANVSTEDFDEVVEYAKFKKVTVTDALNSPTLKAILSEKNEQRKTAQATNIGSSRRSSAKTSDEALLENASKGILPESDEDIRRLTQLRRK